MNAYKPGDDVGALEDWPFEAPESDYRILKGTPRASGRLEAGGAGHVTRMGIWRCTTGVFECTEQGDELMTVLEGHCRITDHANGTVLDLRAGDSAHLSDGARVTWDVLEDVTKVFLGYKAEGY